MNDMINVIFKSCKTHHVSENESQNHVYHINQINHSLDD
jgi:hypothetical protein